MSGTYSSRPSRSGRRTMQRAAGCLAIVLAAIGFAVAPTVAQTPASDKPIAPVPIDADGYKLKPGPFEVVTIRSTTLTDSGRGKELQLAIRGPRVKEGDGPRPVIVFSHGMGGNKDAFATLSAHWASHGYAVIHPTHSDSVQLKREKGEKVDAREFFSGSARGKVDLFDRLKDVKFILDSLEAIASKMADAGNAVKFDRSRIGMAGHSAGAFTTQLAFGVKVSGRRFGLGRAQRNFGDPRISAAIVISGQGLTSGSLTRDSWDELDKPMLVITGSKDVARVSDETPESRRHPFEFAKPGDKYLIFIDGATHSSYGGAKRLAAFVDGAEAEGIEMIAEITAAGTLAFWDAHLLKDAPARAYLAGDGLIAFSKGRATLERK